MTLATNLMMEYWRQNFSSRLPAGYREVEYLESTGEQWIDTGVVMSSNLEINIRANNKYRGSSFIRGVYKDSNGHIWSIFILSGGSQPNIQGAYNRTGGYMQNMQVDDVAFDSWFNAKLTNHQLTVNNTTNGSGRYDIPTTNTRLYISGYEYEGAMYTSGSVVASLSISDSETPIRFYVPCVRISDSKPGMYDLCGSISAKTGTPFYVNSGTGADFLWGELQ